MFLKISQYSEQNTYIGASFLNKVASLRLSCEYCENFKNSLFHKTHPVAASEKIVNFPWNISGGGVIDLSF